MIANTNSTPVSSKKIDWIEELYYSETAEKLMTELSDVPDEVGETIPQIWDKIEAAENDRVRADLICEYGAFSQRVGFKAGYIAAMNIARQCYCK